MTSKPPPTSGRVLLATAAAFRAEDPDLDALVAALRDRGLTASAADWHDPTVRWADADLVVIRSTWDYHRDLDAYLAWVDATGAATTLANAPAMIRWNADKRYLLDVADAGLPAIRPAVLEPGASADALRSTLDAVAATHGTGVVVKPAVSSGSRDTARYHDDGTDRARAVAHARDLLSVGRVVLVQPFEPSVDTWGETALVHLGGRFSHAVRKGPMLRPDAPPIADRPAAVEALTARQATTAERAVGDAVLDWLVARFGTTPLYARVDLLAGDGDDPVVLEVEVLEPALFCGFDPAATERFADAVVEALADPGADDQRMAPGR